ncbi:hypothetical protein P7K49_018347 [Saguinus oedipus]|uniref:Uncharacterized protein n=1 Tax=Saguinus oedipus TaxID=9490 RepID=A0ABQ9V5H1_SAGOE|nr:hypothetical protein P7K49_018347 [Saguinus oedipus]
MEAAGFLSQTSALDILGASKGPSAPGWSGEDPQARSRDSLVNNTSPAVELRSL